MDSRKSRRSGARNENNKANSKAKIKLFVMLFSIGLMVFSIIQVYYLLNYTLGKDVNERHLRVYKWVSNISNKEVPEAVNKEGNN